MLVRNRSDAVFAALLMLRIKLGKVVRASLRGGEIGKSSGKPRVYVWNWSKLPWWLTIVPVVSGHPIISQGKSLVTLSKHYDDSPKLVTLNSTKHLTEFVSKYPSLLTRGIPRTITILMRLDLQNTSCVQRLDWLNTNTPYTWYFTTAYLFTFALYNISETEFALIIINIQIKYAFDSINHPKMISHGIFSSRIWVEHYWICPDIHNSAIWYKIAKLQCRYYWSLGMGK